jgi:FMN phosphatase YigB (HAD superfamily)
MQIPLWPRVVFCDWHGVLSRDPFWHTIRNSRRHPLNRQLEANLNDVFAHGSPTGHEWMRGQRSTRQIIDGMNIRLGSRYNDDFLLRRIDRDCAKMSVNVELFDLLRTVRAHAIVVLATDNMDCFAATFDRVRRHRRSWRADADTLDNWAAIPDDIICSSEVRVLKSEDPATFFGHWLDAHDLAFADAVLIDDRADNCQAFTAHGGAAIQWKMGHDPISAARAALQQWIQDHIRAETLTPIHRETSRSSS